MIVKKGNKWLVKDSSGKKILGTHDTKEKAIKQLAAVEISKKERSKEETMENTEHYYKLKCAELNEMKKKLQAQLDALNEQLTAAGVPGQGQGQGQQTVPQQSAQGQQAKQKKPMSPKKAIESPIKTHHGISQVGFGAEAQEDVLKSYSDNPSTEEKEEAKDASWQSVNTAISNYMQSQLEKLKQSQRMNG
jgi:hypothetical protein